MRVCPTLIGSTKPTEPITVGHFGGEREQKKAAPAKRAAFSIHENDTKGVCPLLYYPPKLSYMMEAGSTPRLSSIPVTAFDMGPGPHM